MKNKLTVLALAAALVAPSAIVMADEMSNGGTAAPTATTPANSQASKGHKKHHMHHNKKAKKGDTSATAPAATQPAGQ